MHQKFFLYFILIFSFCYLTINSESSLKISFETKNPSPESIEKFFESYFDNQITAYFNVGSNKQKLPFYINLNSRITYIAGKNSTLKEGEIKFDEEKSNTFYKNTSENNSYSSFTIYGSQSKDQIFLNNDKSITLNFYLALSKYSDYPLEYSCVLGLGYEEQIYDSHSLQTFLTQIKNNNLINKKIFLIQYKNSNEGEIIFGDYPHFLISDNYKEKDFLETENIYVDDLDIVWSAKIFSYYGEKILYDYLSSVDFEINLGFIIGSQLYETELLKNFFKEKINNGECFIKKINTTHNFIYRGYYCKSNIDISKMKSLSLFIDKIKYKIEFLSTELFMDYKDYKIFLVIFSDDDDNYYYKSNFILGKPFFLKYPMVFNTDNIVEKLGFYNNVVNKKSEEKKNNEIKWNVMNWIFVGIGVIIIGLLIYIAVKYFGKPKKKKANELLDDFEYSPQQIKMPV